MKKIILAVATVSLMGFSTFAQADDKKAKSEKVNKALVEWFTAMGAPEEQGKMLADCMTDKIVDKYTEEEIALITSEDTTPSEELMKKLEGTIMECAGEME